jgi:hypothetical protein
MQQARSDRGDPGGKGWLGLGTQLDILIWLGRGVMMMMMMAGIQAQG